MQLFYRIKETEQYVYHYTSTSVLVNHILPSGKVKLSRFSTTNDPREYKNWVFDFRAQGGFEDGASFAKLEKQASDWMKRTCRILCTTMDGPCSTTPSIDSIYDRGFCKPRMWAQYSENHCGVCIVFDRCKLDSCIQALSDGGHEVVCGPVVYRNRTRAKHLWDSDAFSLDYDAVRRFGLNNALKSHLSAHCKELFLEKASDWADEREYRWIAYAPEDGDLFVSFNGALSGVLVGDRCPRDQVNAIHDLFAGRRIPIGLMNWKSGIPEVQPSLRLPPRSDQIGWPIN